MNERTQGALLLAVGGVALRLGFTDAALAYVKAGLQPFLVAAGAVLLALGAGALWRGFREPDGAAGDPEQPVEVIDGVDGAHAEQPLDPEQEQLVADGAVAVDAGGDDGHDHEGGPAAAWLLVLPLLALLLVAPPALGSYAAERQSTRPPASSQLSYPPLPEQVDGAVELTLVEYIVRALYDEHDSLDGERIRLSGFVTRSDDPDTYYLTRFQMACCAADATAVTVEITGDQDWQADTWLEVEGYWQPRPDGETQGEESGHMPLPPLMEAAESRQIPVPDQTYEY